MIARFTIALVLYCSIASGEELRGRVVKIADGDTLTILDADKVQLKIRLNGIDSPESKQAFGTKSKEALWDKVFEKDVLVEQDDTDNRQRFLPTRAREIPRIPHQTPFPSLPPPAGQACSEPVFCYPVSSWESGGPGVTCDFLHRHDLPNL